MHSASSAGPSTVSSIPTSASLGTICRHAVFALAGRCEGILGATGFGFRPFTSRHPRPIARFAALPPGQACSPMVGDVAILLIIGLIAVLLAAGHEWTVVAACVAVLVLLPATVLGLRRHFEGADRLRRVLDRARQAPIEAEYDVPPPWLP